MKGIVFDLDGTLVDSIPGIAMGVSGACALVGYDNIPEQAVRGMVGKGAWKLCERCLDYLNVPYSSERIKNLEDAFVREYSDTWMSGTVIYPGISQMLERLYEKDVHLGVFTNKPHDIAVELVEHVFHGVVEFDVIQGAGEKFPRKPSPQGLLRIMEEWGLSAEDLLYVGDSRTDTETAQRADVRCLLVSWGYEDSSHEIAQEYQSQLIHTAEELEKELLSFI